MSLYTWWNKHSIAPEQFIEGLGWDLEKNHAAFHALPEKTRRHVQNALRFHCLHEFSPRTAKSILTAHKLGLISYHVKEHLLHYQIKRLSGNTSCHKVCSADIQHLMVAAYGRYVVPPEMAIHALNFLIYQERIFGGDSAYRNITKFFGEMLPKVTDGESWTTFINGIADTGEWTLLRHFAEAAGLHRQDILKRRCLEACMKQKRNPELLKHAVYLIMNLQDFKAAKDLINDLIDSKTEVDPDQLWELKHFLNRHDIQMFPEAAERSSESSV